MYTLTHNGRPLFDPRLEGYPIQKPKLVQEANKIGYVEFTILPGHPEYDQIDMLTSTVSLYRDGVLVFRARPVYKKRKFRGLVQYRCEELAAAMNDYQVEPYSDETTPALFISHVLDTYNSHAPVGRKIYRGSVTVTDEKLYEIKDYCGCWDALVSAFSGNESCYLIVRYSTNWMYLDYKREEDLPLSTQTIEFGKNMADLFLETDSTEAFSALLPLGKVTQSGVYDPEAEDPENPVVKYTTIEEANSGSKYLVSTAGMELFGRRERVQHFNDLDDPYELMIAGQNYLADNAVKFAESVELTAADLHNMDASIPAFQFLHRVNCSSPLLELSHIYPIEKIDIPIGDPEDADISLGKPLVPLSERLSEYEKQSRDFYNEYRFTVEGTGLVINKHGVWAFSEDIDNGLGAQFYLTKTKITASLEDMENSLRAYIELTASHLQGMFEDGLGSLRSYIEITASILRSEFDDYADSLRAYLEMTASHWQAYFEDIGNSLRSYLEVTASHWQTYFEDMESSLRSYLEVTASHWQTYFEDIGSSLRSYLEVTASHWQQYYEDFESSVRSYLEYTASHWQVQFDDYSSSLRSYVEITASHLQLQFDDFSNSLRSYVELTAEHLDIQFDDFSNSLRSYVELTAEHLDIQFDDFANSMRSYVELTASHLDIQFDDFANSLRSYVELTAEHLDIQFDDFSNSLRSYVELTASHLDIQFDDFANSMRSYVELTAEHLDIQFDDFSNSMRSYVELTASHLETIFTDDINSLRSYVEITASHLEAVFVDDISSLRSYVEISASDLWTYFENETDSIRSYIHQTADQIALVVQNGEIDAASIVAAINDAGSSVIISADKINLYGYVTANELDAQIGSFYNAQTGTLSAGWVTSQGGQIGNLTVSGSLNVGVGATATWQSTTIGGVTLHYLGSAPT